MGEMASRVASVVHDKNEEIKIRIRSSYEFFRHRSSRTKTFKDEPSCPPTFSHEERGNSPENQGDGGPSPRDEGDRFGGTRADPPRRPTGGVRVARTIAPRGGTTPRGDHSRSGVRDRARDGADPLRGAERCGRLKAKADANLERAIDRLIE